VLLVGEPGVGKSRMLRAFQEAIGADSRTRVLWYCSPYYQTTTNYPAAEQLKRALRVNERHPEENLQRLETMLEGLGLKVEAYAPILAQLLSLPTADHYEQIDIEPGQLKRQIISAQVALLLAWIPITAQAPNA
jgi:predicted ATPase